MLVTTIFNGAQMEYTMDSTDMQSFMNQCISSAETLDHILRWERTVHIHILPVFWSVGEQRDLDSKISTTFEWQVLS